MLPDALGEQSGAKGARTRIITVGGVRIFGHLFLADCGDERTYELP
jgi:hypothetical protein